MQTNLIKVYQDSDAGKEAESILRSCVHCGFCNATCPTYQLLGNELDGPRGRIYLVKQLLEGQKVSEKTRLHLDRCLSCQSCETTCPSGVNYHGLLDIGRALLAEKAPRPWWEQAFRRTIAYVFSNKQLFSFLFGLGQLFRPILPQIVKNKIPRVERVLSEKIPKELNVRKSANKRSVLILEGCVQDALVPDINTATRLVLNAIGVECETVSNAQCCGALSFHLDEQERARSQAKANIDAWWPMIDAGKAEAVVVNASGCGAFVKDYAAMFKSDLHYLARAQAIVALVKDPVELIGESELDTLKGLLSEHAVIRSRQSIVFHPPCSLQHGQKLGGRVEAVLQSLGFKLLPLSEAHLCCGSAGTYSIFQAEISNKLKENKLAAITQTGAKHVVSANIGCQSHLSTNSDVRVRHWFELLAEMLTDPRSEPSDA